jgi:ribosomal RNA-processing protein 1
LRLDKYLYLIRCYVGVAFEIFLKGNKGEQQQSTHTNGASKKRKREEQTAAGKKKRSKADKEDEARDEADVEEGQDGEGDWAELESYMTIIEEGPLCPLNFDPDQPPADEKNPNYVPMPHGPDGLRYHLLDIWIDEIEKVLEFEEGETQDGSSRKVKGQVPMELLLRPIEKLRKESPFKPVRTRAAETLNDDRLVQWGFKTREVEEEDGDDDSEQEWGGFADD